MENFSRLLTLAIQRKSDFPFLSRFGRMVSKKGYTKVSQVKPRDLITHRGDRILIMEVVIIVEYSTCLKFSQIQSESFHEVQGLTDMVAGSRTHFRSLVAAHN